MAETNLNDRIMSALSGYDPHRVENSVGPGTPDIEYIGGHIESKQMPEWPKRAATALKIPHYTTQQRGWHVSRRNAGGRCHVVIEVERDVFVFDAMDAAAHLGLDWTRKDMIDHALVVMSPWDRKTFRTFIQRSDKDRAGR